MTDSFLDNLLGNPTEGSLLGWLAAGGLWAILIAVAALFAWWATRILARRSLKQAVKELDQHEATADVGVAVQAADSWISNVLIGAIFATAGTIGILHVLGNNVDPAIDYIARTASSIGNWLTTDGIRIVLILFMSWVTTRITRRVIPRVMSSIMLGQASTADHDEVLKRSETLSSVFVGAAVALIYVSALFMVLTELSIPIGPVLGGFGVAGIAVGFGAQYLVRDLIAGIFILAENQYRTGDVVTIAGVSGLVESINLRRTVLRDLDGQVHVIPNGEITVAANKTKYWSRVNLDIGVAYKEDVEQVVTVLNDIGEEIAADPYFGLMLITPPQVLRLDSLDDSAVTFKMLGDCKPMKQWEIMGEMRKRIKIRLDAEGIEIPFPHQTIYWGEAQPAFREESPRSTAPIDVHPRQTPNIPNEDINVNDVEVEKLPDGIMSPDKREELLAAIAISTASRLSDSNLDLQSKTALIDISDSD
ncbi:MAG: mechanosensitive ion channel family protein [SAR202 cluster bacterium]|nr:mechanosensitive ion channel family protein [SAR202 cluster bacterium]|tara:strand:+ start:659 stop:2089 length:1431 start_codon:yes stop_codon:yes gene_type:complete